MGLEKPLGKYSFKQCHVRRCTERTCRGFQRLYKSLNMHPHINTLHIFAYSDRIWYMKKIHKIIYIHHLPIAVYVNSIDIIYISDIPHEHYMAWVMFRLGGWQWYLDCNGCLKPWTPERRPCGFCFRSPWCFWVLVPTQTIGVTWQKNKANIKTHPYLLAGLVDFRECFEYPVSNRINNSDLLHKCTTQSRAKDWIMIESRI